ncbi:hypothetical protein [Paenibacillus oceani]|uniref:Uncharacterized protein n=1 Tax=Paenibacillus oceani TaxID=2772510 RepID=A0A927CDF9_9BACL|nr:hypothetical protein [Paenibacillus oceani]MBD2865590.1 hypothetical protein [Paenibacillus oceani]
MIKNGLFKRYYLHWKIVNSGIVWAAIAFAIAIAVVCFYLPELGLVRRTVTVKNVRIAYEVASPVFSILIFSQLMAEDMESKVMMWLKSLPIRTWSFLLERWLIGMTLVLLVFTVSIQLISWFVITLDFKHFMLSILAPSMLLGHLALLLTVLGRNGVIGMAVPLFIWVLDLLTNGRILFSLYLFNESFPKFGIDPQWNRALIWVCAASFLVLSVLAMSRRVQR